MQSNKKIHKTSQIDQMQAQLFKKKLEEKLVRLEEEWIKGVTKDNRKIDWFRCIYMEAAEAIDSLNWKHWKDINKPDDMNNAKIYKKLSKF